MKRAVIRVSEPSTSAKVIPNAPLLPGAFGCTKPV